MRLNSDIETLAENKVLILYLLEKLNKPITNDGLFKIISAANNINYFYFEQYLADLIADKLIAVKLTEESKLYEITNAGKESLSLTKEALPGIVKLKADTVFKQELKEFENSIAISAEYMPNNEKEFTVKCKIIENNNTVFEIKTFAGSHERAKKIVENWNKNAGELYPQIVNMLLGWCVNGDGVIWHKFKKKCKQNKKKLNYFVYVNNLVSFYFV